MDSRLKQTRRRLDRLNLAILTGFCLIALAAVYWSVVRGPAILVRGDNPRLVEAELKIQRGTIFDVNTVPLAVDGNANGEARRDYPLPEVAPVVGYYSLRYGTAGVEEAYDAYLRGESDDYWSNWWHHEVLSEPLTGRDLKLTVDSRWQRRASDLLGDSNGAVLLLSLPDVAIRAMASSPGYDPGSLDSDFEQLVADEEAPLLNRVTQGQYQPGLLLQPFLLAFAAGDGLIDLRDDAGRTDEAVMVDGQPLVCQADLEADMMTWANVLEGQCPGPMVRLGERMGMIGLQTAIEAFGLTAPSDQLAVLPEIDKAQIEDVRLAAIGQDLLGVNPLQIGVALATLANNGQLRPASLVAANQDELGRWQAVRPAESAGQVVPARIAGQILAAFEQADGALEHGVIVLSGPEGELNSWYLGLAPAANPRYGVVVVVENDQSASLAQRIGRQLLKSVLDPGQS